MATPAAMLAVQVQAQGIAETSAKLRGLDGDLHKVGGAGTKMGTGIDDAGKKGGKALGALKTAATGVGAIVAFDTLKRGVGGAVAAFEESRKVAANTEQAIKATGGAANVTAAQVGDLSSSISKKAGVDDEAIQSGANLLLTFKNVRNEAGAGKDVFNQATQAAVDLSAAGFGSISSASKTMGKALNDPVKGISALSRAGVTFSEKQKTTIEALMATGKASDRMRAQQLILKEVQGQVGGQAAAQATSMDHLKVTMGNLAEDAGAVLVPTIDKLATALNKAVSVGAAIINWFRQGSPPALALGAALGTLTAAFVVFKVQALASAAATNIATMATTKGTIAYTLNTARLAVMAAATKAYTAVQWLMNAAMTANPIALVVVAIVALIAAFVLAYKKVGWFRDLVNAVWAWLKDTTGAVFGAVVETIKGAWSAIAGGVSTAWAAIKAILVGYFTVIKTVITTYIKVWTTIFTTAWAVVKAITTTTWRLITGVVRVAAGVITAIFTKLRDFAAGVWGAIRDRAVAVWNAIRDKVAGVVTAIWERLKSGFGRIVNFLDTVGDKIRAAFFAVWNSIRDKVAGAIGAIVDTVQEAGAKMLEAGRNLVQKLIDGIKAKIGDAVDTVKGAAQKMRDVLPFSEPKDRSSPFHGLAKAGEAIVANVAAGVNSAAPALAGAMGNAGVGVTAGVGMAPASSAGAGVAPSTAGPLVAVAGDLVIREQADADALARQLAWAVETA